ncbi:MAG: glycine--tRNA ligase subunit beta [Alphaproteobacteria bacterium]|nr:glycine--tRNA ligase subunit beta [Alphaproteobacteria bacterium]OJV16091.1 MAG: glycine--tRNA ligase subunit beta [Alphaproteobacteria bacterium 33-17]
MSELLLEIFGEEIPARMQLKAKEQLKTLFSEQIAKQNIEAKKIDTYVSSRRLVLHAENISVKETGDQEIRGPRTDANQNAIDGFLKKYGKQLEDLQKISTDKGEFFCIINKASNIDLNEVLTNIINGIIRNFNWSKSMKWSVYSDTWVRPIRSIVCLYDGKVLPVSYCGVKAGRTSQGHRFISEGTFEVRYFADYAENLKKRFVYLNFEEKMQFIWQEMQRVASDMALIIHEDKRLLEEVAGLVEWPLILVGNFSHEYLKVPPQIIESTMKSNQRYFPLYNKNDELTNKFIIVSNSDYHASQNIIKGNEKVISARLADAKFFFEQDLSVKLEDRVQDLSRLTFHEKLGNMFEKSERLSNLALYLAMWVPFSNLEKVETAARLAKADLTTNAVSEFPELQGLMGSIYAHIQGNHEEVCEAIYSHYLPLGPDTECPKNPESIAVALSDKIDTIVGFFSIGEIPTSSKDPYALRRAALGIIRIILENNLQVPLKVVLDTAFSLYPAKYFKDKEEGICEKHKRVVDEIYAFILDRFKFLKKQEIKRQDVFDAVMTKVSTENLSDLNHRIKLLESVANDVRFKPMLVALNRAISILSSMPKVKEVKLDTALFEKEEENALYYAVQDIKDEVAEHFKNKEYFRMFELLTDLTHPINRFFDGVIVNDDRENIKLNRVALIRSVSNLVKDFADFALLNLV